MQIAPRRLNLGAVSDRALGGSVTTSLGFGRGAAEVLLPRTRSAISRPFCISRFVSGSVR
jgi:hypothetical protein